MRYKVTLLSIIAMLLISGFPISSASASPGPGAIYYVDTNHPGAEDSSDHGSIDKPWRTLQYAFQQLQPGDTLLIRGGTYDYADIILTEANSGQENALITVKAYPNEAVTLENGGIISFRGANWFIIDGLIFDQPQRQYIQLGQDTNLGHSRTVAAEHITIRNCEFKNGKKAAIDIFNANDILIESCYFHHIRPGTPFEDDNGNQIGWEVDAIPVLYKANNITIKNSRFEDIGSDGVQIGAWSYKSGASLGAVTIADNEFWVNRPYTGILGNVGENAIDVKGFSGSLKGPVLISGNKIHGFRPTTPEQDASGADGDGITIHNSARNIIVEKNHFYDNTSHLYAFRHKGSQPVENIIIRNNVFQEARVGYRADTSLGGYALMVGEASNIEIYHNTFYNNDVYLKSYGVMSGTFKNNVVYGGRASINTSNSEWEADYNAWSQVVGSLPSVLQGSHDLHVADLMLGVDLRPLPNSPVINAGYNCGLTDDFDGNPRSDGFPDLGAFEYVGDTPTPTPTPASTVTPTPTLVPTYTPTALPTSTPTPTSTPIPVPTDTVMPTYTATPSLTSTPTSTPTDTLPPTSTPALSLTGTPILAQLTIDEPLYVGDTSVKGNGAPGEMVVIRDMDDLRITSAGVADKNGRYTVDLRVVLQAYGKDGLESPHTIQAEMKGQIYQAIVQAYNVVPTNSEIFLPIVYSSY
jgi:hypothetical protein